MSAAEVSGVSGSAPEAVSGVSGHLSGPESASPETEPTGGFRLRANRWMTAAELFVHYVEKCQREMTYGCSWVAHQKIGFCLNCPQVSGTEEALGWRLLALAQDEAA